MVIPYPELAIWGSIAQSFPTFCSPMDCNTPGFPDHQQLPELAQTHVHRVGDAIQSSHPLLTPSHAAFNLSQHQGLFQWVSSSHQVARTGGWHRSSLVLTESSFALLCYVFVYNTVKTLDPFCPPHQNIPHVSPASFLLPRTLQCSFSFLLQKLSQMYWVGQKVSQTNFLANPVCVLKQHSP